MGRGGRRRGKTKRPFLTAIFLAAIAVGVIYVSSARAQQPSGQTAEPQAASGPSGLNPEAITRGRDAFGASCGFCHGRDAHGTGAGADLTTSSIVLTDQKGVQLGQFLQAGRPEKGMPAFPNLNAQQVSDMAEFLHSVIAEAHKRAFNASADILVGDGLAGKAFFEGPGKCGSCHSAEGDLKGIGARLDPVTLEDRLVYPRARGLGTSPPPGETPKTVAVTLPSGQTVSGTLAAIDDFSVTLVDAEGNRKSFTRDNDVPKVVVRDPLQPHLDLMTRLSDTDMHNLTAYLASLK